MTTRTLTLMAAAALLAGCAETRQFMGAAHQDDANVLTGGPVSGTKIIDLPQAVRQTLMDQMPSAEIADIDRVSDDGKFVYEISFIDSDKNPGVRITETGQLLTATGAAGEDSPEQESISGSAQGSSAPQP